MLEKIKTYKSYIIITIIIILIIVVYIIKQASASSIANRWIDPNGLEHSSVVNKTYKVYNFGSELCPACDRMDPIYEKIKEEYNSDLDFEYINVDKDYRLAVKYKVEFTPTFIVVDESGTKVDKLVGYVPENEFREFVDKWGNK